MNTEREYYIVRRVFSGENYASMVIIETATDEELAEYILDSQKTISAMYREIDRHLANGGTLHNYQW